VVIFISSNKTLLQRIESSYCELSVNGRKIADRLTHNPMDVARYSLADLAQLTQTSKATVSRFFSKLGYQSYQAAKQELLELRQQGYPLALGAPSNSDFEEELQRIRQTLENISSTMLEQLTQSICQASRVTIIGFRNSYPLALHFRQQLLQLRSDVSLLPQPGQTLSEELQDIAPQELFIVIGFRRRTKLFERLINTLPSKQVVLLADPSAQIYKEQVKFLLICQLGQTLALDSYAAPMSVISIICNNVLAKLGQPAQQRIESISKGFNALSEIE
jgi:DNA-binding MurR/RpiR family transcriptional regulator